MASNSVSDLSPEQVYAHKFAAQELAKYCQEFSSWRRTKRASAVLDKSPQAQGAPGAAPVRKPDLPAPPSSA
jgi:hypothetical protein